MRLAQLEKLALSGFSHRPGQIRVTPQPCLAHKSQRQFGANLTPNWRQFGATPAPDLTGVNLTPI